MTRTLFYDTETTGTPSDRLDDAHHDQPRICQIAAILEDDETGQEVASLSLVVHPFVPIPDEAARIHGITNTLAKEVGVQLDSALRPFLGLWKVADRRVGHNEAFDARMVRISILQRIYVKGGWEEFSGKRVLDAWDRGEAVCTCEVAAPFMNLPPTERMVAAGYGGKPKPPKLEEAYLHYTGHPLQNAHNALADVRACRDIYRHLEKRKALPWQAPSTRSS